MAGVGENVETIKGHFSNTNSGRIQMFNPLEVRKPLNTADTLRKYYFRRKYDKKAMLQVMHVV